MSFKSRRLQRLPPLQVEPVAVAPKVRPSDQAKEVLDALMGQVPAVMSAADAALALIKCDVVSAVEDVEGGAEVPEAADSDGDVFDASESSDSEPVVVPNRYVDLEAEDDEDEGAGDEGSEGSEDSDDRRFARDPDSPITDSPWSDDDGCSQCGGIAGDHDDECRWDKESDGEGSPDEEDSNAGGDSDADSQVTVIWIGSDDEEPVVTHEPRSKHSGDKRRRGD